MGINLPEGWVPAIQLVSFLRKVNRDFLISGCASVTFTRRRWALATPSVHLKEAKVMQKRLSVRACELLRKRTSREALVTCSGIILLAEQSF